MTLSEFGSLREIWFAPLDDPNDKTSFLIRDDAYTKSGVVFGRSIRLGDPVSLGPKSTWTQVSWEGGNQQETWRDPAMFADGDVDTYTARGRLQLPAGWQGAHASATRNQSGFALCAAGNWIPGSADSVPLYIAERNRYGMSPAEATYGLYKWDPATDTLSNVYNDSFPMTAMCKIQAPSTQRADLFIGCLDGRMLRFDTNADTVTTEYTGQSVAHDGMCQFGDGVWWGGGTFTGGATIYRRTESGGTPAHTAVRTFPDAQFVLGLVSWNSRLWFATTHAAHQSKVWATDGVAFNQAFTMPGDFTISHMCVHYGALYIAGTRPGASGTTGQVWRYTGSSLSLLWEKGSGSDGEDNTVWALASWGKYLCWGRLGEAGGSDGSLVLYDAELDAIHYGSSLKVTAGATIFDSIVSYNGTLAVGVWNPANTSGGADHPTGVFILRPSAYKRTIITTLGGSSWDCVNGTTYEKSISSSEFDGEVPGEDKTWLTGRVKVRLTQAASQVEVRALIDSSSTEYSLATINYDSGDTQWRTVEFKCKDGTGEYLRSRTLQYKLYLRNSDTGAPDSTSTPEVDAIEIDYMPSPVRRRQWRVRIVANDDQDRLDGTANPLTTTQAIRDAVETLWADQRPVYFWDAGTDGEVPVGNGIEVFPTSFMDQPYRLASDEETVNSELSLEFLELA